MGKRQKQGIGRGGPFHHTERHARTANFDAINSDNHVADAEGRLIGSTTGQHGHHRVRLLPDRYL